MLILGSLLVLSFAVGARGAPRIVGGNDAPDHQYPFIVILYEGKYDRNCSGTILNERWILTSAACAKRDVDSTVIVAGTNVLSERVHTYAIESVVVHWNYDNVNIQHDIALIRVQGEIHFDVNIRPVVLPKQDLTDYSRQAVLIGWGTIASGYPSSVKLQEARFDLVNPKYCASMWPQINDDQICTSTDKGTFMCYNDWGSPLLVDGIQVGIASFGDCTTSKSDVYTRVWSYRFWIQEMMAVIDGDSTIATATASTWDPTWWATTTIPPSTTTASTTLPTQPHPQPPSFNGTLNFHLNFSVSVGGTLNLGK